MEMVTLYRPVGLIEAELIMNDMFEGFPKRLSWQPIFYPVLNIEYASEIASRWNIKDLNSGFVGIVTKFEVPKIFYDNYQIQQVGDNYHKELWVKSEDLPNFNDNIVNPIKFIKFFYGSEYKGLIPEKFQLKKKNVQEQLDSLIGLYNYNLMDFDFEVVDNWKSIYLNLSYWEEKHCNNSQYETIFIRIKDILKRKLTFINMDFI